MADTKTTALTALDAYATGDLIPMVDDPAGTAVTKKSTIDQVKTFVKASFGTGVATALDVNIGSAGAFITFNGALGTPSSGTLTNATGLPAAGLVASTSQAVGFGSIELGHASDTTIARASAGDISVEGNRVFRVGGSVTGLPFEMVIACSDETTALTAGSGKIEFRMPRAVTLTEVRASLTTAQAAGNIFTVDINEAGTTIISTKITIDNTEKTSVTAVAAPVISDAALASDALITVDIDQIGDGSAKGLKITLIGTYA